MGMYTYFTFDGTVKEKYRKDLGVILSKDYPETFEDKVIGMNPDFTDFANGERASMILGGYQCDDDCTYNPETGELHLECDIKNYSEQNSDGTYKPKNSSKLFIELLPELCETDKYLAYSSFYEEDEMALRFEYVKGKWIQTNKAEYDKAWNEAHSYGLW